MTQPAGKFHLAGVAEPQIEAVQFFERRREAHQAFLRSTVADAEQMAVGAGVAHLKEGDRVGAPWLHTACGRCPHCVGGWETLCESQQNTGYSVDGGYAEFVRADANYVGRLPDALVAAVGSLAFIRRVERVRVREDARDA